jgi:dTDP-4-amino-4,6-dideoxygalactose transaminase
MIALKKCTTIIFSPNFHSLLLKTFMKKKSENSIQFLDFYKLNKPFEEDFKRVLLEVIENKWYILGEKVKLFEQEYANFSNSRYCIGVANGLDALVLSLKSLDIKEGDEVIVPSNTYIASWLAVTLVGAKVVPVEPDFETYNIDYSKIEEKINKRTKAIMAVSLYGQAAELVKILKICNKHNIHLVEDNAQAHGATCEKQITGSFGIVNATSFYPGKNLGALGDAGAITTNDETIYNKIKLLRNYGSQIKYENEIIGHNSRLDELQAAFLSIKLKRLNEQNRHRIRSAQLYNDHLNGIGDIILPKDAKDCTSVFHIYQIRSKYRTLLQNELMKNNISTMIHYPKPPHLQKAYSYLDYKIGDFPIAEEIANTTLSLPMDPHISNDEIFKISSVIKNFFNTKIKQ